MESMTPGSTRERVKKAVTDALWGGHVGWKGKVAWRSYASDTEQDWSEATSSSGSQVPQHQAVEQGSSTASSCCSEVSSELDQDGFIAQEPEELNKDEPDKPIACPPPDPSVVHDGRIRKKQQMQELVHQARGRSLQPDLRATMFLGDPSVVTSFSAPERALTTLLE